MFEGIKKFFLGKVEVIEQPLEIGGFKIMTVDEIVKDNEVFSSMDVVVRYLYTKDKERDTVNQIGFIGKTLDKPKEV